MNSIFFWWIFFNSTIDLAIKYLCKSGSLVLFFWIDSKTCECVISKLIKELKIDEHSNLVFVFCSSDISNGKIYIGSATGEKGIWQRWCSYAKGLKEKNKDFINILTEKGDDYIRNNFTYSILEIFDIKTKDEYIISREYHWMKVFQTQKFGMNN